MSPTYTFRHDGIYLDGQKISESFDGDSCNSCDLPHPLGEPCIWIADALQTVKKYRDLVAALNAICDQLERQVDTCELDDTAAITQEMVTREIRALLKDAESAKPS